MSVPAELTHDAYRYAFKKESAIDVVKQIAQNKESPFARSGEVLWSGKDYSGAKIQGTWNRIKEAAIALAPVPLPASSLVRSEPGMTQRQLTASVGIKTEPAPNASQQIGKLAKAFREKSGLVESVDTTYIKGSPQKELRDALRKRDNSGAMSALQELRKTKKDPDIFQGFQQARNRPFTGSMEREAKFKAGLTPQQRALYDKAKAERDRDWEAFRELWRNKPSR